MTATRRLLTAALCLTIMGFAGTAPAQNVRTEAQAHPRIAAAINALEDAVRYMEAAPHDFGGHKADAIRDSRAAIVQLRQALAYRAQQDRRR